MGPWTDFATGYANYDYYTAGAANPLAFRWLRSQPGSVTAEALARRFAEANPSDPDEPNQPSIGATVPLRRMKPARQPSTGSRISSRRVPAPALAEREQARAAVRAAAVASQHYDTEPGFAL